ncbi:pilus assembly protein TadG-related protein [Streptomyces sp. NPDC048416]|uniref:pilus assembly protein TadG-related protein n=1 Tax=Streptomyces sp. NPDC048416 TaxID=3365546 RepID=UPI00371B16CE
MSAPRTTTGPRTPHAWPRAPHAWFRARRARLDDRGSAAAAVIIFAVLFLGLAAFVIDGGLSISKRERAADIAEQAARYAAQDIDKEALYDGSGAGAPIRYQNCGARVKAFAQASGLSDADVAASGCLGGDAQQVQVEIQLTYKPVFTGFFYGGEVVVRGRSVAKNEVG